MHPFEAYLAEQMHRRYVRVVGRGTTALYIALRALAYNGDAKQEIILPDIICSAVLDAVLLAGYVPIFADVTDRFALDWSRVQSLIAPSTRAVIHAHNYGFVSMSDTVDVPLIEDAVQGLGGYVHNSSTGLLGDISLTSFHQTKMINGCGGLVATDDPDLWAAIERIDIDTRIPISIHAPRHYHAYSKQLAAARHTLIRPFNWHPDNIQLIHDSWYQLQPNISLRNEKAAYLRGKLSKLPLNLPPIHPGDAIWRYTFAAPSVSLAHWILRHLQWAGLPGSSLYPSLRSIFAPELSLGHSNIAPRLINLWVDEQTTERDLDKMIAIICAAPFDRLA